MATSRPQDAPLLFVHVSRPGKNVRGRDVREAVQRHVMRDIGKQRRGRPRPKKGGNADNVIPRKCQRLKSTVPSTTLGGRIDPSIDVPVHMRSSAHFLIDHCNTFNTITIHVSSKLTFCSMHMSQAAASVHKRRLAPLQPIRPSTILRDPVSCVSRHRL